MSGAAMAGCDAPLMGMGTTATQVQVKDARMHIHNLKLLGAGGEVAVTLDEEAGFQHHGVALLDFENGVGSCADGTTATHTVVTGTVPSGAYTGLAFTVGVPFAQNHQDTATADAPLNLTSMWWNWNGGYKFIKLDMTSTGAPGGWVLHLGSTGCTPEGANDVTTCANPNRVEVRLPAFDAASDAVALDLSTLLQASNVDVNAGGAPGCMSGPTDPECAPNFCQAGVAHCW